MLDNMKMDAMKGRFANETPEEQKKRRKSVACSNVVAMAIPIAMLVVGVQYNNAADCPYSQAALYLIVGGAIGLGSSLAKVAAYMTPCEWDDKLVDKVTPLADLASFIAMIWGSVVVFGSYSKWEYENASSNYYCDYTPFVFAFVILIIQWIMLPIMCFCGMMFCCCAIMYKAVGPDSADQNA